MCSFPRTLSLIADSVTIAIQQEPSCVIFCLTSAEVELSQGPTQPLVLHTNDHILFLLSYMGSPASTAAECSPGNLRGEKIPL